MVLEHESDHISHWTAIASIAVKIGSTPEMLRLWVKRAERGSGQVHGGTSDLKAPLLHSFTNRYPPVMTGRHQLSKADALTVAIVEPRTIQSSTTNSSQHMNRPL